MGPPDSAAFRSHSSLSRFDPLPRIFYYDDFNQGMSGETALVGDYEGSLERIHPGYRSLTQPTLSNKKQTVPFLL